MPLDQLTTVNFHGDTIFAVQRDGVIFIAVKPICETLGLAWTRQLARMKRDAVLVEGMTIMVIPSLGGPQETVCLPLDMINGWLFGIEDRRVAHPEMREKILAYKRECYRALFRHFQPEAAGVSRDPDAGPVPPTPGLDEITQRDAGHWLSMVREARLLRGRAAAIRLWEKSPLPPLDGEERPERQGVVCPVVRFIRECCTITGRHDDRVLARDLIAAYGHWARGVGAPPLPERSVALRLREASEQLGFAALKSNGVSQYTGLVLHAD